MLGDIFNTFYNMFPTETNKKNEQNDVQLYANTQELISRQVN